MSTPHFTHSPTDGCLGCVPLWVNTSDAAKNFGVQVCVRTLVFISHRDVPGSGVPVSVVPLCLTF